MSIMQNEFWIKQKEKAYRDSADKILFDIRKRRWDPEYQVLERFYEETYGNIVSVFRELEKTQEYCFNGQVFVASECKSEKSLAFCVGEGLLFQRALLLIL